MFAHHGEAICLRKSYDRLIILFRRPEACREFVRLEKLMKIGALRVVDLLKQLIQGGLVSQRQTDGEGKIVGGRQTPFGSEPRHGRRHVAIQHPPVRSGTRAVSPCYCEKQRQNDDSTRLLVSHIVQKSRLSSGP